MGGLGGKREGKGNVAVVACDVARLSRYILAFPLLAHAFTVSSALSVSRAISGLDRLNRLACAEVGLNRPIDVNKVLSVQALADQQSHRVSADEHLGGLRLVLRFPLDLLVPANGIENGRVIPSAEP